MTALATPLASVRAGYDAFARGDVPAVLGLLDPQVEWTEAAGFPYPGTFVGPQAVLNGVFMKLGAEWEGWSAVPQQFVAQGDVVVALGDYGGRYRATGRKFSAPFVHVWTFRGGKVVRFRQHTDTVLVREAMRA
jgi:hypothetical protein